MSPRSPVSAKTMLTVLAYFRNRGPVAIAEAAADLSLTDKQLRTTLRHLWMCGGPGYDPYSLIDLSFSAAPSADADNPFSGDQFYTDETTDTGDAFDETDDNIVDTAEFVELTNSAGIDRPLRLSFDEAVSLKVALTLLVGRAELVDQDGVREALEMLDDITTAAAPVTAAGGHWVQDVTTTVNAMPVATTDTPRRLRQAVEQHRAVRFVYHSASSDTSRIRIVDDLRLIFDGDHTYVRGFDRHAADWRVFRADRIAGVEDFGPSGVHDAEPHDGLDVPTQSEWAVLRPGGQWLLDEFPFAAHHTTDSGEMRVQIPYFDRTWLRRFLLGYAQWLTPDDPQLRAELAATAKQALALYAEQDTTAT